MKAVVLHEYGGPEKLKYEEVPDPKAGAGEVVVRTAATSVNPVDYKMRSGEAKQRFPVEFPGILGRDVSGTVLEIGLGVEGFQLGERVMALSKKTYADRVVVKAEELTVVPDKLDLVDAAALPLVCLTGEQLVRLGVQPEKGWTVLVSGAVGSVGRVAVFTAKQMGARVIAGVRKKQMKEAATIGADEVVALDDRESMGRVGLLDAVADAVGGETAERLMEKVKQGGVFASVLGPPKNAAMHPTVRVAPVMAKPDPAGLARMAEAVADGTLVVPVERVMPLREAGQAQRAAERGGVGGKILLTA